MRADDPTALGPRPEEETRLASPTGPRDQVPRRGQRLAGCEVTDELGRGGMGVVLGARDEGLGRSVAIKLLLEPTSAQHLARLEREGELLARLDHPGIVRVHRAGQDRGRPFLVVELVPGARPIDRAAAGLPLEARARLLGEAAAALGHAHARGVVHRDVKPANLLVGDDGRARVTDFGLAVAADVERLTRTGHLLGTPHYMAPEQLATGRALSPATDVWALGAVLFELLAGRRPFEAESYLELLTAVEQGAPPLREAVPGASPALEAVVARALQREPAGRFADGAALAAAIEQALVAPAAGPPRPWQAAIAAAGLVAGVGLALVATHGRSPAPPPIGSAPPTPSTVAPAPSPPERPATWTGRVRSDAAADELRGAARALDADQAAGRPPTDDERAAALRVLAELDRRWRPGNPGTKALVDPLRRLLWIHALWRRLDPTHLIEPTKARALIADASFLTPDEEIKALGAELARLCPGELAAHLLHVTPCYDDPTGADLVVVRRSLALARAQDDETARAVCLRILALTLDELAATDPAARQELLALATGAAVEVDRSTAALLQALAAAHAPPADAPRLLAVAEQDGAGAAIDRLARARGWRRLARTPGVEPAVAADAGRKARGETQAALAALMVRAYAPPDQVAEALRALADDLPPPEALGLLDQCLAQRPRGYAGVALVRVLVLARAAATGASTDAALGEALGALERRLEPLLERREPSEADRAWLAEGLALVQAIRRASGRAEAVRTRLAAWSAAGDVTRVLDR